jgi:hypothetical protein
LQEIFPDCFIFLGESPQLRVLFFSDLSGGIKNGGAAIRTARRHQRDVGPAVAVQGDNFAGKGPHPEIFFLMWVDVGVSVG